MMTLYDYFRSTASFRVRIALNLKNIEYKAIPVHLTHNGGEQFSADYKTVNPHSLVPTLVDGDKVITQSLAIIEYLDQTHPTPPLLPQDPYQQAFARSIALDVAADMHPLNNLRVLNYLTNDFGLEDEKKNQWYRHWIQKGFHGLEKKLSSSKLTGDFCLGNSITLADVFLVPQLFNARRFSCDVSAFPTLTRIDANCQKHPAFIKAWPQETK